MTERTRIFRGWTMVAATHVLFALIFGAMYSFGAFFEHVQAAFGTGRFGASAVFSATAFLYYAFGLVSGALADRFSARAVVGCGIVLLALGFALGSLAPSLGVLLLVFCGLVGAGVGIAALIGASVAAWMFDLFQSYAAPIAGSALLAVLSAVCLAMAGRQASRRIDCLPEKSVA